MNVQSVLLMILPFAQFDAELNETKTIFFQWDPPTHFLLILIPTLLEIFVVFIGAVFPSFLTTMVQLFWDQDGVLSRYPKI